MVSGFIDILFENTTKELFTETNSNNIRRVVNYNVE